MSASGGPKGFEGRLIWPADDDYESAARVDNMLYDDRRPALIARAHDADDVATVIRFAREHDLRLAVRSGGHSAAGFSTGDGVVVLDLGALNRVDVDARSMTAWAEPGVGAAQFTQRAFADGLAASFGDTGKVGLGGLIVGGGIGWLVRRQGLTIDSLLAAEVITASGERIVASEAAHPELFWALRGGGGNFGVVTRYRLALRPIGPRVLHGTLLLRASERSLAALAEVGLSAPDDLTVMPLLVAMPAMDELPDSEHGKLGLYVDLLWAGEPTAGEPWIERLRRLGPVLMDTVEAKPLPAVYAPPSGIRSRWIGESLFLDTLDGATAGVLMRELSDTPSAECLVQLRILGGAVARVPATATAYAWRDRELLAWIIADFGQANGEAYAAHRGWIERVRTQLAGHGSGGFVSFMSDSSPASVARAYPSSTLQRLRAVKRRYDPDNFFAYNHNVTPA